MKTYIDVMRHANAGKIPELDDYYRPLSQIGIAQAVEARERYNGSAGNIRAILHSGAPRALCSAVIAAGKGRHIVIHEPTLWVHREEPPYGELLWESFEKYEYDLQAYHNDEKVRQALMSMGERSADTIRNKWFHSAQPDSICIIAGHAIFNNFTAYHLAQKRFPDLLSAPFQEAEAVRLAFWSLEDNQWQCIWGKKWGKILIVDSDACRSPMFAPLLGKELHRRNLPFTVESASLMFPASIPVDRSVIQTMEERGVDISTHRIQSVLDLQPRLREFKLIYCMKQGHLQSLENYGADLKDVQLLSGGDIPNPWQKGMDEYRRCADILQNQAEQLAADLEADLEKV